MNNYKAQEIDRLDKIVSKLETNLSRETIQRMIKTGKILVNGKTSKPSYKTTLGDNITIEEEKAQEIYLKPQEMPLDIIYEDNNILVINKEKGIVVHPGNGNPDGTLANAVMARCKESLSGIGGKIRPGIVHRIDKDTSGLIIIAKNDTSHINLSEQIQKREVKKTYIALVRGNVKENEATINMPIGRSTKDRKKMAVTKTGKEAITHFQVIKRYEGYTLLEVNIETGRTHQIRVHLSEIGYPIVGDEVYSNGKNPFNVTGQMLHAAKLKFKHPATGEEINVEAPLPEYFEEVLAKLRSIGTGYDEMNTKMLLTNRKETKMEPIRLQKYLAEAGIASRRKAEEYIMQGKVKVNGQVVTELGTKITPNIDKVEYNGRPVQKQEDDYVYILLNKPIDYVTTVKDQFNRNTVLDLVKTNKRLVPVGRLDMYTSGALILTNDGDFVYKITHPKHEITKTYTVTLKGIVTREDVQKLENGVDIGDFITNKAKVKILKTDEEQNKSRLEITIHEGKNRQVRRMCEAIDKRVLALHRSKIGNIGVKDLKLGTWRYLRESEVDELLKNC